MILQGRDLKLHLSGEDVRQLQEGLSRLGYVIPDGERQHSYFGDGTRRATLLFQNAHTLAESGTVNKLTAAALGKAMAAATYFVSGTVTSSERIRLGTLRIQIVDKNLGEDVALAETTTDDKGCFSVALSAQPLQKRNKARPDLLARAYVGDTFLAASEVRYNATTQETLSIILPASAPALPSELTLLTRAVAEHYDGALAELKETADQRDITYVSNKIGWDARAVALADGLSKGSGQTGSRAIPPRGRWASSGSQACTVPRGRWASSGSRACTGAVVIM